MFTVPIGSILLTREERENNREKESDVTSATDTASLSN
jgi:hypothetical protein